MIKKIQIKKASKDMKVFVASVGKKRRYSYGGGAQKLQEKKIEKALGSLKNMKVGLFLRENQFIEGILLDVKQDHVILNVNQNICYFALQHIQAISNNAKDWRIHPQITSYLDRNYLADVLMAFRYNWVTINGWSNQEAHGVLSRITENHIMLINNEELINIPKSYISTIFSRITEEQINFLNNREHLDIQQSIPLETNQKVDQQITTNNEMALVEKSVGEVIEVENERHRKDRQEKAIHDFLLRMNAESIKQSNSQEDEEIQHSQHIENMVDNYLQPTSNNQSRETKDHIVMEHPVVQEIVVSTIKNEYAEVQSKVEVIEKSDLLLLDKNQLMNSVGDDLFEGNHVEVLESAESVVREEKFNRTEPQSWDDEKKILLSAWSTIHNEQRTIAGQDNYDVESEYLLEEDNLFMKERDSENFDSSDYKTLDNITNDEILAEKTELAEITDIPTPVNNISAEEEKEMLKMQYYALMIHAAGKFIKAEELPMYSNSDERNIFHKPITQISLKEQEMLEKQYYSLMKYAEKMYYQLKDLGLQ